MKSKYLNNIYNKLLLNIVLIFSVLEQYYFIIGGNKLRINFIGGLLCLLLFLFLTIKNKFKIIYSNYYIFIVVFIIMNIFSLLFVSPVKYVSLKSFLTIILSFIYFIYIFNILESEAEFYLKRYINIITIFSIISLISYIVFLIFSVNIFNMVQTGQWGDSITLQSTFIEANLYGIYLSSIVLIILYYYIKYKTNLLLLIIPFIGLILSWTRIAWLTTAIGITLYIIIYLLNNKKYYIKKVLKLSIFTVFILIILFIIFSNIKYNNDYNTIKDMIAYKAIRIFDYKSGTADYRIQNHWIEPIRYTLGNNKVLFGSGREAYKKYNEDNWIAALIPKYYYELGIVGLTWLIFFFIYVILDFFIFYIKYKNKLILIISISFVVLFLGFNGTTGFHLSFFWTYLAIVLSYKKNLYLKYNKIKLNNY